MAYLLVVDDHPNTAETVRDLLEIRGHTAHLEHDLGGALLAAKTGTYDLVLTDKNLGAWRGVDPLLQYMEEERPDTPVIVFTAEPVERASVELRAHAFIEKCDPKFRDKLFATIDELVKRRN